MLNNRESSLVFFTSSLNQVHSNGWLKKYSQFCGLDVFGCSFDCVAVLGGELGDELQQGGALVLHGLPVAAEQRLVLSGKNIDACLQLWETIPNVMHQQPETEKMFNMVKVEKKKKKRERRKLACENELKIYEANMDMRSGSSW